MHEAFSLESGFASSVGYALVAGADRARGVRMRMPADIRQEKGMRVSKNRLMKLFMPCNPEAMP